MPEILLNEMEKSFCAMPCPLHNLNEHSPRMVDVDDQDVFKFKPSGFKTVQICTQGKMKGEGEQNNQIHMEEVRVTDGCRKVWQKIKLHIAKKCYKIHREPFQNGEATLMLQKKIQFSFQRPPFPTTTAKHSAGNGLMVESRWSPFADTQWTYRGEGNANLVISLPQEKIIFRFHKLEYNLEVDVGTIKQEEDKVKRDVQFSNAITDKFIGIAYVQPPHYAKLPDDDAVKLDNEVLKMRPIHRRHKGVRSGWVTISPDYAFLPPFLNHFNKLYPSFGKLTFCVELKPKQGWIHPEDRHHPKCTFCMNQYLKVDKKSASRISNYCPLDLFSGNEDRMVAALRNLLETPQNNLKIFQDGLLVYSDDVGNYIDVLRKWMEEFTCPESSDNEWLIKKWCLLIQKALIREMTDETLPLQPPFTEEITGINCNATKFTDTLKSPLFNLLQPCDWSAENLPQNSILNRILQMQKLQTSGFKSIFRKLKEEEDDYCYVRRISENKNLSPLERYLLATTAKDCSIMIAFQRAEGYHVDVDKVHYIEDCNGTGYIMNIGVSDLDPKPLSCASKHFKRDKDVLNACLRAYQCEEG